MTRTIILIPARYASTRFPGKPLAVLKGARGHSKSLVERTWDAARAAAGIDSVLVATDDERIRDAARAFGADIVMTSPECRNGTERCAEASQQLGLDDAIVINVQGDAPLTPSWYIEALVDFMTRTPDAAVSTPVIRATRDHLAKLKTDRVEGRVGGTTAVFDNAGRALYFSKEVLPFGADPDEHGEIPVFHHVGIYAYRPEALNQYVALPEGRHEVLEGLEQLRFLENGIPVHCVEVETKGRDFWELNNPSDIGIIEDIMAREGLE